MMKKILAVSALCLMTAAARAADTYGYLCVALAYPKALGAMRVENAVVITSPRFTSVHQVALNQCIKKYGVQGQCGLETVYCTSSSYYGGTVRSLIQNLK